MTHQQTKQPLISVIVPVFNAEQYLDQCIETILHQTYRNIEIIIINDGSSDHSLQIINTYKRNDNRIKTLTKENHGVSAARNDGLSHATGDYVMFVDADDYIADVAAIELIVNSINTNKQPDLVMFKRKNDNNNYEQLEKNTDITKDLLVHMTLNETINTLWNKVYKRKILGEKTLTFRTNIRMGEDLLFNIQYFDAAKRFTFLDKELYYYRDDHTLSATKKYMNNKYDDLMYVNNEMQRWKMATNNRHLSSAIRYIRVKNIISSIRDLHHKDCPLDFAEKRSLIAHYKQENPQITVNDQGAKVRMICLIYSMLSPVALYTLTKVLAMKGSK